MNAGIDQAVLDKTITAAEDFAAHNFARIIGSAIRAAANPGDPGQAFASAFLDDVFRQVGPPGAPTPELVVGSPTTQPGGDSASRRDRSDVTHCHDNRTCLRR